jgi:hypothetical protein
VLTGLALLLVLGGGVYGIWRGRRAALHSPPTTADIERLTAERLQLRDEFRELLGQRNVLDFANAPSGNILVGIPTELLRSLVSQAIAGLFSEMRLRLRNLKVHHQGDVKAKVLLTTQSVGHFALDVDIREIRALLKPGAPELTFGAGKIGILLPVTVPDGQGDASVRFQWNGAGLAGAFCGDADVSVDVSSRVRPATYRIQGEFLFSAEGATVVAKPSFGEVVLKIRLEPGERTWKTIEETLARLKDEKGGVCGLAIERLDVRALVQRIIDKGFDVKLPSNLLRPLALPASVEQSVDIQGKSVTLGARPTDFRVTPEMLWYGADFGAVAADAEAPVPR